MPSIPGIERYLQRSLPPRRERCGMWNSLRIMKLLLDFDFCLLDFFDCRFGFEFLELDNGGAERFVDRNLLAENLERHHETVACGRVGVAAPAFMTDDGDAKVLRERV